MPEQYLRRTHCHLSATTLGLECRTPHCFVQNFRTVRTLVISGWMHKPCTMSELEWPDALHFPPRFGNLLALKFLHDSQEQYRTERNIRVVQAIPGCKLTALPTPDDSV